jgi:hypothetical protein
LVALLLLLDPHSGHHALRFVVNTKADVLRSDSEPATLLKCRLCSALGWLKFTPSLGVFAAIADPFKH